MHHDSTVLKPSRRFVRRTQRRNRVVWTIRQQNRETGADVPPAAFVSLRCSHLPPSACPYLWHERVRKGPLLRLCLDQTVHVLGRAGPEPSVGAANSMESLLLEIPRESLGLVSRVRIAGPLTRKRQVYLNHEYRG